MLKKIFKHLQSALVSLFKRNKEQENIPVNELLSEEAFALEQAVKKAKEENCGEDIIKKKIEESFCKMTDTYPKKILEENYIWSRIVKLATKFIKEPLTILLAFADESNYKTLYKSTVDLLAHRYRNQTPHSTDKISNTENFLYAFCHYILDNINPTDAPSYFMLGEAEEKKHDFAAARKYYEQLVNIDSASFKGIVSLISSYTSEVKYLLAESHEKSSRHAVNAKIRRLNHEQQKLLERHLIISEHKACLPEASEEDKLAHLTLTSLAVRLERSLGNYAKAFSLLEKIPEDYPEIYRLYLEKAMLFQFKPYENDRYDLTLAIMYFNRAHKAFLPLKKNDKNGIVTLKSILMPLANAYHKNGMDDNALHICDEILRIDKNEYRAQNLKNQLIMA